MVYYKCDIKLEKLNAEKRKKLAKQKTKIQEKRQGLL